MGARILIAEDDVDYAGLLCQHLTRAGHQVTVVDDGVKLFAMAVETLPQLVITDIQMPGGFGSTAYTALRQDERTKAIPVVFISAHVVDSFMPDDPLVRFIGKPVDLETLCRIIAEFLPKS